MKVMKMMNAMTMTIVMIVIREIYTTFAKLHTTIDNITAMRYNIVIGGRKNKRERRRDGE